MKTLVRLLTVILCMGLLFACSEPDEFLDESADMLKGAKLKVYPSSASDALTKAEEDWANINEALQNAGSREVVQLAEGLFYLHKSIVRWDFDGTLKGSGRDKTTIQTMPGEPFDVSACPDVVFSWNTSQGYSMFCFPHKQNSEKRTVEVSNLTIVANEPATEWLPNINAADTKNGLCAVRVYNHKIIGTGAWGDDESLPDKIDLNVVYKNLSVIGEEDSKYSDSFSFYTGLSAIGASKGSVEAKNVFIKNADAGMGIAAFFGENSIVNIKNCQVENISLGVTTWLNSGWIIQNNKFKDCSGDVVYMNTYSNDYDVPVTGAVILNNSFSIDNTASTAFYGGWIDNVKFYNNYFEGSCKEGLVALRGSTWDIKDNNFCKLNVSTSIGATIRLYTTTNSIVKNNANQIVGGKSATDPSNIIGEGRECND